MIYRPVSTDGEHESKSSMKTSHHRNVRFSAHLLLLLGVAMWLSAPALLAQIGPRPGTSRRNYPLGGLGMPIPDLPEVNYKGKIEKLDDKIVLVKLDDGRTANFERTRHTKFFKDEKEIKASDLKVGDRVSVDAALDPQAYLTALRVTFDRSPAPEITNQSTTEEGRNFPSTIREGENGRPTLMRRSSESPETNPGQGTPPPAGSLPGNHPNGRPSLLRREPPSQDAADQGTQLPANPLPGENANDGSGAGIPEIPMPPPSILKRNPAPTGDAIIDKARAAAMTSSEGLPQLICEEVMANSTRDANATGWQPLDQVTAETIYADGEESHRQIKVNNQSADQQALAGSWPIGRLLGTLKELFSPETAARFNFGGDTNLFDLQARIYDFDVASDQSQWAMRMGSQSINAAYGGTVWIDKESGRVLRLEMQARDLPAAFPLERLETNVEYSSVRIAGKPFLLPTHVETMGCQRDTHACTQSVIDFRTYRAYVADATSPAKK